MIAYFDKSLPNTTHHTPNSSSRFTFQYFKRLAETAGILLLSLLFLALLSGYIKRPSHFSLASSSSRIHLTTKASSSTQAKTPTWPGWPHTTHIFAFGDSYTSTSYDLFKTQPNDLNPFGNPDWQLDLHPGSNWLHFLGLHYNQSALRIYNLAVGGSTIDPDIIPPFLGMQHASLRFQLEQEFLQVYAHRPDFAPWTARDSLFMLWFGINDVVVPACQMNYPPIPALMKSYREKLDELYGAGARNFLVLNVPPVQKAHLRADYSTFEGAAIMSFNRELANMRDDFAGNHTDATVFLFDAHSLWSEALRDPKEHEQTRPLRVTEEPCDSMGTESGMSENSSVLSVECDGGRRVGEYFWLNALHATWVAHNLTANYVVEDCFGRVRRRFCT